MKNLSLLIVSLFTLYSTESIWALSYPVSTPTGETAGGTYRTYFDNIFQDYGADCSDGGRVVGGFNSVGVPNCVVPVTSGFFLTGQTSGDTIRFDGTDWVRNNLLYNNGSAIGIANQTPAYLLDVAGTANFIGIRMPTGAQSGAVLTSDATGIGRWSTTPTISASGITGGVQDYLIKWGPSGNGLVLSQFFDNGTEIGLGTITPTAGYKLDIVGGDLLVQGVRIGRGGGVLLANTVLGANPLIANVTSPNNIVIGNSSASILTAGAGGNILIGNGVDTTSATAGNELNIGNWIYGSGGNIGIGVTNTGVAKLEIAGRVKITGGSPAAGRALVTDATGLASWQDVTATNVTATGITGGTEYYIAKFGSGGNGLYASLLYETGSYIGLGNTDPTASLDISGNIRIRAGAGSGLALVSDASGLASWQTVTATTVPASGVISGVQGYLPYFGTGGNGLYSSLLFQTGSFIGIGTPTPTERLEVTGTGAFYGLRISSGATAGHVLTSDATGNARWSIPSGISGGQTNYMTRWLSATTLGTGSIYQSGAFIGINTTNPGYTLDVNGTTNLLGLRMTTGSASGRMLISDDTGNAAWTPTIIATDFSLSGSILGATPYYNGTNWVASTNIYNAGGNIGIGTATPGVYKLNVNGNSYFSGDLTVVGRIITDTIVNRTVNNVSISGSLLPDIAAPLIYRDIGSITQRWRDLYLSGQVTIGGGSPGLDKILTSDVNGLATWQSTFSGNVLNTGIVGGSSGYLSVFGAGGNGLYSSIIFQTGSRIGVATTNPGYTLDVSGTGSFSGFRLPTGAVAGRYLSTDAAGNSFWTGAIASNLNIAGSVTGSTLYFNNNTWNAGTGLYNAGGNIGIGTANPDTRLTVDSGLTGSSGLRFSQINSLSTVVTTDITGLGVDGSGNVVPISNGDVVVYDADSQSPYPNPNPNIATRDIRYDFNRYFMIPAKQSFVVSDGQAPGINAPYIGENATSSVCGWDGSYGAGAGACPAGDFPGSPYNSFTMSARSDANYGYQIGLAYRGDIQLMARSGRFRDGADAGTDVGPADYGSGLYIGSTSDPAPWYKVITLPTNQMQWFYIDTGYTGQWNVTGRAGNIGVGTRTPDSRFEIWNHGTSPTSLMHFRGSNNLGIGSGAVRTALSGNANTGIGHESLFTLTSGYSNTSMGYRSMRFTAGGFNNSAFGQEALYNNNGGSWNNAFGYQASYSNTSGTGNIAIGPQSVYYNAIGTNNIGIGYQAIRGVNGNSTSNNVAIGQSALYGVTGNNNVSIGAFAGDAITTGTNNITIGYAADVPSATASNQLSIGNWIYGSGGNIGIGVTVPTSTLDVSGTFELGTNGTQLNSIIKATVVKDVASRATLTCGVETFAVANALTTGSVMISPASALADRMIIAYARVSAAGTVEAKFCNESTGTIDLASMNYYITVIQ